MKFLVSSYNKTGNLKLLALFPILVLFSWLVSYLIATSSTFMIMLAILAVVLFAVIFFNPLVGLMLLFFIIPFEYLVNYPIFKIIALVFCISWLARKAVKKELIRITFKTDQERYLIGLAFALILSLVFSIDKPSSLLFFQRFILLIALCIFLIDVIRSPKHIRNLGLAIGLSGGLAGLVGLMQYYIFDTGILEGSQSFGLVHQYKEEGVRVAGFTGNPNHFAMYLVISTSFLLYCFSMTRNLILRILIIVLIGCSTASIFFTLSRSGVLALGIAIVVYSLKLKGLKFTAFLSLPIIIGLALMFFLKLAPGFVYDRLVNLTFHEKDQSAENRIIVIKSSVDIFLEHPHSLLTGMGLNNFQRVSWTKRDAHNMFVQMLVETGLIGFTFFSLLVYRSYRDMWHYIKLKQVDLQLFCLASLAAFTALLVHGLSGTDTYIKYLWLFFVLAPIIRNIKKEGYART
jgi:O-antigen ligase